MKRKAVLVFDCGATNIRAILVSDRGEILASAGRPNQSADDPYFQGGRIWDTKLILEKLIACSQQVNNEFSGIEISALTVTTFGVDGTFFDQNGKMLYPVISWQCNRTIPVMEGIGNYIDPEKLFRITGLQSYHFNTISKMVWFRQHMPHIIDEAKDFLFMPSIILYYLCGAMVTDTTMAGTSMLTDMLNRNFSHEILGRLGSALHFSPTWLIQGR
jgi:L-fuculokinase